MAGAVPMHGLAAFTSLVLLAPLAGAFVDAASPAGPAPPLPAAVAHGLATADAVLALAAPAPQGLGAALPVVERAMRHQGLAEAPPEAEAADDPAGALRRLAEVRGLAWGPAREAELAPLRELPAAQRATLAALVGAFLDLEAATRSAIPPASPLSAAVLVAEARALGLAEAPTALPTRTLDAAPVRAAQLRFLRAAAAVQEAWAAPVPGGPVLTAAPAFALDLAGEDSVHDADVALLLDVGGHDTYRNNGGGNGLLGLCVPNEAFFVGSPGAAALVDLAGSDRYVGGRSCGGNGGGAQGSGLLVDAAGDDLYLAGSIGVNGGGAIGVGLLLDLAGDDAYGSSDPELTGSVGGNGGGYEGDGMLLDLAGRDVYTGGSVGTNGGGVLGGRGFLLDAEGDDRYDVPTSGFNAGFIATNGGAVAGSGMLLDGGGHDAYTAPGMGANGGAGLAGVGFLLDAAGDDVYVVEGPGLGERGGNGGAQGGLGFLLDRDGNDAYLGGSLGVNGGAVFGGLGILMDRRGDDVYLADDGGTNGGGMAGGSGFLLDEAGDDRYVAGADGANGGAARGSFCSSLLLLVDCAPVPLGGGLLLDLGGADQYADAAVTCADCSVLPKGEFGAQLDQTAPTRSPGGHSPMWPR